MFKFVNAGEDGSTPKRQQSQRACSPCRKRKKRCHHGDDQDHPPLRTGTSHPQSRSPSETVESHELSHTKQLNHTPYHTPNHTPNPSESLYPSNSQFLSHINHTRKENNQPSTPSSYHRPSNEESMGSRFIGDLNPESVFLAATNPPEHRGVSTNSVGVWLKTADNKHGSHSTRTPLSDPPASSIFYGSSHAIQTNLAPLLKAECLSIIPPPAQLAALSKIYFDKMHPMFPVIDYEEFHKIRKRDNCQVLLQQAVCLAASKNFAAAPHLLLGDSEVVLSAMEFGDKISAAMRLAVEMGMVTDKIVMIQALALMSQFFDSVDRGVLSSEFCARAVHVAHSIGLHVKVRQGEEREHYGVTLLCCIYSVDRMNAAFNGRPVLMHERDGRKDMEECFNQQPPTFRLFLQVIMLLDKIIDLYRVTSCVDPVAVEVSYPSFEDLVLRCEGESIGTWSLATIETLYHAVTILSHRHPKPPTPTEPSTNRSSSPSYLRQTLSTTILSSTIPLELHDLILFPFVPYALALALSTSYREMRHGGISLHRARARRQFQVLADALGELKGSFRSAERTAEMGIRLLREMDRVVSGTKTPAQQVNQHGLQGFPSAPQNAHVVLPVSHYDESSPSTINTTTSISTNNNTSQTTTTPFQQFQHFQDFDPSIFDSVEDVDLFGLFDPAFNLDGFDACLGSTLDPSFPTYF